MEKVFVGEKWKPVQFDFEFINDTRVEISNFGRVKTFNRIYNGKILKGSSINGYNIIRLKFFKKRDRSATREFNELQKQVAESTQELKQLKHQLNEEVAGLKEAKVLKARFDEISALLATQKENSRKWLYADGKGRTIHYHALVHRLVAEYFIPRPTPAHTVVAHIDYDKSNNRMTNLKWMTPEENYEHQRFSPNAIASKTHLEGRRKEEARSTKLTVTKVMLLKKLLNEGKTMKQLVKQFKITETQILRIKRGVNWAEIPAAPSHEFGRAN